jgi:3-oxoacyl-[acyl-carrier protein] reductase
MIESLRNKKVLVTGASGGIGKAIVTKFLEYGAQIAVSGSNEKKLHDLATELQSNLHIFPCNLADHEATSSLVNKVEEELQGVDIVVCNAGITKDNLALRMTNEDFIEVVNLNLISTFILNKAAIKLMMKRRHGRIINVSSVIASMGNPGQANYAASKAGIEGLTRSLAKEVASRGITINCVAPGFIETPMTEVLTEEQKEKIKVNIPNGNLGKPEYVAHSVVFLGSDLASYITGQTLHVNGGLYMG